MASGWNLWVWLECIGVVSGCCCKEVYRYPHNNYYFSLLNFISSFLAAASPISARSASKVCTTCKAGCSKLGCLWTGTA